MPPYYQSEDLARWDRIGDRAPGLWEAFQGYYAKVFEDGALSAREKALIALAVAHILPCAYCIDANTRAALETGATPEQIAEAVHVASATASGAALAHSLQMRKIVDELSFEGDGGGASS
jgi:alkylhydroperoxidase/carboxymuconolactone decarboxylase family protein